MRLEDEGAVREDGLTLLLLLVARVLEVAELLGRTLVLPTWLEPGVTLPDLPGFTTGV
jgi:hypothetical protein